jgi:hypothetical protein
LSCPAVRGTRMGALLLLFVCLPVLCCVCASRLSPFLHPHGALSCFPPSDALMHSVLVWPALLPPPPTVPCPAFVPLYAFTLVPPRGLLSNHEVCPLASPRPMVEAAWARYPAGREGPAVLHRPPSVPRWWPAPPHSTPSFSLDATLTHHLNTTTAHLPHPQEPAHVSCVPQLAVDHGPPRPGVRPLAGKSKELEGRGRKRAG